MPIPQSNERCVYDNTYGSYIGYKKRIDLFFKNEIHCQNEEVDSERREEEQGLIS